MIDRLFTAALAFTLLAGGTTAIGSALFGRSPGAASPQAIVKRLPTVEMEVPRAAAAPMVRLAAGETDATRSTQ